MRETSLQYFCCPSYYGDLALNSEKAEEDETVSGILKRQTCRKEYKIEDGIPDFICSNVRFAGKK